MTTTHTPIPPLPDGLTFDLYLDYEDDRPGHFSESGTLRWQEIEFDNGDMLFFSVDITGRGTVSRPIYWGEPDFGPDVDSWVIDRVYETSFSTEEGERDLTPDELASLTEWLKQRINVY